MISALITAKVPELIYSLNAKLGGITSLKLGGKRLQERFRFAHASHQIG